MLMNLNYTLLKNQRSVWGIFYLRLREDFLAATVFFEEDFFTEAVVLALLLEVAAVVREAARLGPYT